MVPFADQGDFFDHAVLTLPMPPPPPGEVPEELQKVIDKACAKKVNERYPTPLALREAIEAAVGTLASDSELADFLKQHFPNNDTVRAGRRQAIDAGIADLARRQWAERKATTRETPAVAPASGTPAAGTPRAGTPVQTPAQPARAGTPVQTPATQPVRAGTPVQTPAAHPHPLPRPIREEPPPEPPKVKAGLGPIIGVTGAVVVIFLGLMWLQSGPKELPPSMRQALADAGTRTPVAEAPDAGPAVTAQAEDAGAPGDAGAAAVAAADSGTPVDAGAAEVAKAPADAGTAAASTSERVSIEVKPACELTIDGKPAGKTPFSGVLSAGRHVVILANKEIALRTSRAIVVTPGQPLEESWSIGRGTITISAPEGAQVFIDDVRIGSAPIRGEVPVYEGSHRISVTVGKARWNDNFYIESGGKKSFNVSMQ